MKQYGKTLLLLFTVSILAYGQYGKITGKITDRDSKEPLVGASILIEGTSMGAATNVNGDYVILNVPVGTYDL